MDGYKPSERVAAILDKALASVQSVQYGVTTRWVFYRMVQFAGLTKRDYGTFKKWTSRARKNFYNGWTPDTMIDDTREIHYRGHGYSSIGEWIESMKKEKPTFDKIDPQKKIVQIWFEAQAMIGQFKHYAQGYHVALVPFKGDPSIQFKWRIAKYLDELTERYPDKPIEALYFGDLDPKGRKIPESALKDIATWTNARFEFRRIGLEIEHVKRWKLPDNPEKPGEYQWEALPDEAARELITRALKNVDTEAIEKVERREERVHKRWKKALDRLEI